MKKDLDKAKKDDGKSAVKTDKFGKKGSVTGAVRTAGIVKAEVAKHEMAVGPSGASASAGPAMHVMTPKPILKSPARHVSTSIPPGLPNLPGFTPAVDTVAAGANPFVHIPNVSIHISTETELADARAALEGGPKPAETPPAPPGVNQEFWSSMGSLLDTKLATVHSTLDKLAASVVELQENAVHKEQFVNLMGQVETIRSGCEAEFDRSNAMESTVTTLAQGSVQHDNRIGALEKRIRELDLKQKGPDDSYKRIVFKGLPKCDFEDRCAGMRDFMAAKLPKIHVRDCSVYYRRNKETKAFDATNVGYVEFASSAVRDHVFNLIDGDKNHYKCTIKGKQVDLAKARTRNATDRNTALTKAADLLKKIADNEHNVDIVWVGSRGVTVKGVYAYEQPAGTDLGHFCGDYAHLELP